MCSSTAAPVDVGEVFFTLYPVGSVMLDQRSNTTSSSMSQTFQIWDGLWLACVVQSTGQMQCKKPSGITYTTDLQAGRALTLLSIILGLIGFIIAIMGGGVANCSSAPPDDYYTISQSGTRSSQNKVRACLSALQCLSVCLHYTVCLSVCTTLSVFLTVYLSIYLSFCMSVCLSAQQCV